MVKFLKHIFACTIVFLVCSCRCEKNHPQVYKLKCRGRAVAVINGDEICREEVEKAAKQAGITPREALSKLIDESALADEAIRKGFLLNQSVIKQWKKLLAQKFLQVEVEKKVPVESVTLEDIKKYYVNNYEGRGVLLEQAWRDIRDTILKNRRKVVYNKLIRELQKKYNYSLKLEKLKMINDRQTTSSK